MTAFQFVLGSILACAMSTLTGCGDGGSGNGGSGGSGTGGSGGSGSGGSDAPAACKAVLADAASRCPDRECIYSGWSAFCDERSQAVKATFDCLTEMDDCQTPADPSDAKTCMEKTYQDVASDADRAIGAAFCLQCVGTIDCDGVAEPLVLAGFPVTHIPESDGPALKTCLDAATDCNGAEKCLVDLLEKTSPELIACK